MTHRINMGVDGIVRTDFYDAIDDISIEFFLNDIYPFVNASSSEYPLNLIINFSNATYTTSKSRKLLLDFLKDKRIGKIYIQNANKEINVFFKLSNKIIPDKELIFENNEENSALSSNDE